MKYSPIEIGDKFGRLTVIKLDHKDKKYEKYFLCKCSCGKEVVVRDSNLKIGKTKSCGCIRVENMNKARIRHNKYEVVGDKIKCYTSNNEEFYISIESKWVLENYCWHMDKNKYLHTNVHKSHNKKILLSRLLMQEELNKHKGSLKRYIDHIDGNPINNCLDNLRVVTAFQNAWNVIRNKNYGIRKEDRNTINPYVVSFANKGSSVYLGSFSTMMEAKKTRDIWEKEHDRIKYFRHGEVK